MPQRLWALPRRALTSLAGRHWIVALAAAKCFSEGLLLVGLPVRLDGLGWWDWELGLRAAVHGATYALSCVLFSLIVQRLSARALMSAGAALSAAAGLGLAVAESKWQLYALSALFSFATSAFWVPLMAWIGESRDEHLVGDMAAFNFAWMGSLALGTMAGGLAETAAGGLSIYVMAGISLGLAGLAPFAHIRGKQATAGAGVPGSASALPRRMLLAGWAVAFFTVLAVSVPLAVFVKLNTALGYTAADYAFFLSAHGVARVAIVLALAAFQGWREARWPMWACLLIAAGGGVALAAAGSRAAFAVGFVLIGMGAGMGYMLGFYYSVHGRRHRKRNAGLFEAMIVSQKILGGSLGGVVATHFSRRAPYAMTAVVAVVVAAIIPLWLRRPVGRHRAS